MKLSKILICSGIALWFSLQGSSAKYFSLRLGGYDFTQEAASDFYNLSPMIMFDYSFAEFSRVQFNFVVGASYRKVLYNENHHDVSLFPAQLNLIYNLPNLGSKLSPYFGAGLGAIVKYDKNEWLEKAHVVSSYGYNILFGFSYQLNKRLELGGSIQYNLYNPPNMESINVSGIYTAIEFRYNLGKLLVVPE